MLLVLTNKGTPGLRVDLFVPIMTVTPEIELQLPPTPQLKGRRSYLYMPREPCSSCLVVYKSW